MPFATKEKNKKLTDRLLKLKIARSSARVYASQILSLARAVKAETGFELEDLKQKKFLKFRASATSQRGRMPLVL